MPGDTKMRGRWDVCWSKQVRSVPERGGLNFRQVSAGDQRNVAWATLSGRVALWSPCATLASGQLSDIYLSVTGNAERQVFFDFADVRKARASNGWSGALRKHSERNKLRWE